MKTLVPGYYVLEKPKRKLWLEYFTDPFLLLGRALSFPIKRAIINVAFGPDEVKLQNPIHVMFLTDDRTENGSVIVNLLPSKSNKTPKSYFNKIPPLVSKIKPQKLLLNNSSHKAYVDAMIVEIGHLIQGSSKHDKCFNKKFAIKNIHIKGIERLDAPLAHYFKEQVRQRYDTEFFERPRSINMDFYSLETANNALLESVQVSNTDEKMKPMSERKFVITCMARNQNYIYWLKDFYISAKNIGCTVIGFNYRGIDYSKGRAWIQDNMIDDALAQAQYLFKLGVKPENIAFEGMSMGGAVATIAAAKMHDQGLRVKLYNERSYRSLFRLIVGYIMPASNSNPWSPINWLKYTLVGLTYIVLAPVIWLAGWHLDAASAWDRIPQAYKTYSVARNHENPEHYDDDDLIHDSFSSIASLMTQHLEEIKQKQNNGKPLSAEEQQLLADKTESHEFTLDRDNKANKNPSSHSAPRRFLIDTQYRKQTMQAYMIENLREKLGINPTLIDPSENPNQDSEHGPILRPVSGGFI